MHTSNTTEETTAEQQSKSSNADHLKDKLNDPLQASASGPGPSQDAPPPPSTRGGPSPTPLGNPESPGGDSPDRGPERVQFFGGAGDLGNIASTASAGIAGGATTLPHLDSIQASFGSHDVSSVQAHTGGAAQEANTSMGSEAFATGNDVAFATSPNLHTAAHEAAHIVQQRAGVSLKGGVGAEGDRYEQHADAVADKVVRGESAEPVLDQMAPAGGPGTALQHKAVQMGHGRSMSQRSQGGGGGEGEASAAQVEKAQRKEVAETAVELGNVDSVGGMQHAVGGLLDALAPGEGDKRKLAVKLSIAVNPVVSLGLGFSIELSRDDSNKLKLKTAVDFNVTAAFKVKWVKALASAKVGGYLEAVGNDGVELMRLIGLAIHQAIEATGGPWGGMAAEKVFGEDFERDVREEMDDTDYVKSGLNAGVTGKASIGGSAEVGDTKLSGEASVDAALGGTLGVKMTRDGNEQESSTHAHAGAKLTASVSGNIPVAGGPWAAKASITAEARTNKGPSGTIAVNATRNVDMAKFMDPEDLTENFIDSVCGSVSVIASLVKNKGLPGGVSAGQLLGQMSKSSIASSVAGGAASKALTDKLGDIASASMKQALDISLKWSGGEATLTAQLAKSSKLKIAQDIRAAKLDVTIENLTRMCRLSKSFTTLRRSPTV